MMGTLDSDELLKSLNTVNDNLLELAQPIDVEDALMRENEICAEARMLGIPFELPEKDNLKKGMILAEIEQKCRIRKSGITYMGKSLTAIYNIPTQSADVTTEMIIDYTENGELKRAYTRTADRKGNRWSIQIDRVDAMKLEKVFGLHEMAKSSPKAAEHQKMSQ